MADSDRNTKKGVATWGPGHKGKSKPTFVASGSVHVGKGLMDDLFPKDNLIWMRMDTPFHGEGQRVQMVREKGVTKAGYLSVPFRFQHPPLDSVTVSTRHDWSNYTVLGGKHGANERTRSGGRGLDTFQMRTMFTDWPTSYEVWSPFVYEPILAVRELKHICKRGVIFRLKMRNRKLFDLHDLNWLAVLLSVDVEEVSGEPDARYVTLSFQQYRDTEVDRHKQKRERHRQNDRQRGGNPKLKDGDTLRELARHHYGTQAKWAWQMIADANKGLGNWPPSRPLDAWAKKHHRTRIKVPPKPESWGAVGDGRVRGNLDVS